MKQLHVIVDLQFGSCGKGLFAGFMAKRLGADTLITAWAPNAGHTFVDEYGKKMVTTMLASGIVAPSVKNVLMGPGSVINLDSLGQEITDYLPPFTKIWIHENAAVVSPRHRALEASYGQRIGSTMKGAGEALIDKIKRDPELDPRACANIPHGWHPAVQVVDDRKYAQMIDTADIAIVEGAQGYSLSLSHGFWPYCTSRECTTYRTLSDCGVPTMSGGRRIMRVYGVCRTFPIRVSNRMGATGPDEPGYSGPGYNDQKEISWAAVGVEPELTTVTKLPRRVFSFSYTQVREAIRMNGVHEVFLNFCNYLRDRSAALEMARIIERDSPGTMVRYLGWGPRENEITFPECE